MTVIKVPENGYFTQQAQLHYQVRDGLNDLITDFAHHHETILSQLDSSQVGHYRLWWQDLNASLVNQATLHDQLGKHLTTAGQSYQTLDQNIAKSV